MMAANVGEILAATNSIIEMHRAAAGDEEDVSDAVFRQGTGYVISNAHGSHCLKPLSHLTVGYLVIRSMPRNSHFEGFLQ